MNTGRRFDAVIFDNDGLLLDTEDAWTRAEETLFARRGREFTIEHKREMLGQAGHNAEGKLAAMLELPDAGEALFKELQVLALEEIGRRALPRPKLKSLRLLQRRPPVLASLPPGCLSAQAQAAR